VLRSHQRVVVPGVGPGVGPGVRPGVREGQITSGSYSPTLERSIALARVPAATGERVQVDIRGKLLEARVVKPPFVRAGQVLLNQAPS
jgi:aminomethyltransferase